MILVIAIEILHVATVASALSVRVSLSRWSQHHVFSMLGAGFCSGGDAAAVA